MLIASWTTRPPDPRCPDRENLAAIPPDAAKPNPVGIPGGVSGTLFPPRYSGFLAPGVLGRGIGLETASRFARDLMVQEVGFAKLQALGIKLVAADSPHSFLDDTPTSKLIRQILGAVSEFDKAMVVAKLKGARERKRVITGKKVEGRKSHVELRPELVALVRQLRRKRPKGGQRSLRDISAELAQCGIMNERGVPFSAASINSMLNG